MPDQPLNPHQAAVQLGISIHTVRRWCADHAAYLSPSASPAKGATRRLSPKDMEVLQEVARLRSAEGLTAAQINERLAGVVFPDSLDLQASPPAQDAPGQGQAALVVVEALRSVEARLQALEQNQAALQTQRLRVDVTFIAIAAFVAGLIVGLAVWWFQ